MRINHNMGSVVANYYLEAWSRTLEKYGISNVVFYGGVLRLEDLRIPYGRLSVRICDNSDDSMGNYWYHFTCTGRSLFLLHDIPSKGYLFAHDDALLNLSRLSMMDTNVSWFTYDPNHLTEPPGVPPDLANDAQVQSDPWGQLVKPFGAAAVLQALSNEEFAANYKKSLWECLPYPGLSLPRGQADVFFISSSQLTTFQKAAALFAKFGIFLEIAVPSIAHCVLRDFKSISLYTRWDNAGRGKPPPPGTDVNVIQPLKISAPEIRDFMDKFLDMM